MLLELVSLYANRIAAFSADLKSGFYKSFSVTVVGIDGLAIAERSLELSTAAFALRAHAKRDWLISSKRYVTLISFDSFCGVMYFSTLARKER